MLVKDTPSQIQQIHSVLFAALRWTEATWHDDCGDHCDAVAIQFPWTPCKVITIQSYTLMTAQRYALQYHSHSNVKQTSELANQRT